MNLTHAAPVEKDVHSFSDPQQIQVTHIHFDLEVDFDKKILRGKATYTVKNLKHVSELVLDTHSLKVDKVTLGSSETPTSFQWGTLDPILGTPLKIAVQPNTTTVTVYYETTADSTALQWVSPDQTSDGKNPALFSQSESIHARSWFPCQDTPSNRITSSARIRVPPGLWALMSAKNPKEISPSGVYTFEMKQAIPTYLISLAVIDLRYHAYSDRVGVYSEPSLIEKAAWEFDGIETSLRSLEEMLFPYPWEQFDLLVMVSSYPLGGMEHPRVSFLNPALLAGDRSLTNVADHELSHSYTGNFTTNQNWNHFWLNEGFTVYLERRLVERTRGKDIADLFCAVARKELDKDIKELPPRETHLRLDLKGRHPDDGLTDIAYEKGYLFLRMLEEYFGRPRFDPYLKGYLQRHAFQSLNTDDFLEDLRKHLLKGDPALEEKLQVKAWIDGPGLPSNTPQIHSTLMEAVQKAARFWRQGSPLPLKKMEKWTTYEWVYFLYELEVNPNPVEVKYLDDVLGMSKKGNSEILTRWFVLSVRTGYEKAFPTMEAFLKKIGRMKHLAPIYEALHQSKKYCGKAKELFEQNKKRYHPMTIQKIEKVLSTPCNEGLR